MNVRLLLPALLLGLGFSPLFAQEFRPLAGYDQLQPAAEAKAPPVVEKRVCSTFDLEGITLLAPGENLELRAGLDTTGLGDKLVFGCEGCADASGGIATFRLDTLRYGAASGAVQELDTLVLSVCNQAGDCAEPLTVIVLVQRAGRTIELGDQAVDPGGVANVVVPPADLPGGAFCRSIAGCAPTYPGRGQDFYFLNGFENNNNFRYFATRYGGTDAVCVTVCNELGLCDVYRSTFTVTRNTTDLPFFDDFSYGGFRPAEDLWQDEDVLINRNFAINPPSVGVATFDAVNSQGAPYTATGTSLASFRDFLTSTPIDLQGAANTALNFYLQPRGLGNRPERQDSFVVQFLTPAGNWNTVFSVPGMPTTEGNNSDRPFIGYTIPVGPEYQYFGFQFRFASKSTEQGAVDMWHLDYVKLDNLSNTLITQDMAFVNPPEGILEPYTALPIRQYQAAGNDLLRDSFRLAVYNLRNDITPMSSGNLVISTGSGQAITSGGLLSPELFGGATGFAPQAYDFRAMDFRGWNGFADLSAFLAGLDSAAPPFKVRTSYRMIVDTEDRSFAPGIVQNDTVSTLTCFDEFMAYDDGTAEVTLEGQEGTVILQQFDAFVPDMLVGLRIRIPRGLGGLGDQPLRLVVYTGDTVPVTRIYEEDFPILYAESFNRDTLQGYTTYLFEERLDLPVGRFFVGWEQQRANRNIGIGFDRNNQPENVQWFDFGNGWQRLTGTTRGAIMVRPLLAGFDDFQTSVSTPTPPTELVTVYPNPTSGTLHLRPRPGTHLYSLEVRLYTANGSLLRTQRGTAQLALDDLPAGLYLLQVSDGQQRSHHKIIRR
ncbi:T9SS type A sorting domain-containing protein [Neolewinella lacunae]|uniref:T9SS type A sorting domain-containing protein n=1 Tax=Neolewinella lacunae TaxID=1517758 RepID=A0A923PLV3_9BACT|nr:T9SS type A sorting domain-containing protein [Neolewinella lacunae]MBC6994820.1 T9SS type A sorting domain-containing protein [Neolewinella lacunae]MDN3634442.1 T9SS type A sorting domain-containing protein [Neolewinella lacunae]